MRTPASIEPAGVAAPYQRVGCKKMVLSSGLCNCSAHTAPPYERARESRGSALVLLPYVVGEIQIMGVGIIQIEIRIAIGIARDDALR
jgi:hypothetical protein